MKTKLLMASSFLAVAGIAVVSYATGLHSGQNYLNADQVNFKPLYSSHHQRQLKDVAMWDTMLTKISTWVENHESRLQARASSSTEYPNLSAEETSFRHLIQARENNGNKLTEQMWDSLQTQLSKVALNHEMRLRMQASQSTQPSDPIRPQLFIVNKDALTATSTDYQSDPAGRIEMQVKIFPAGNYTVQYSSSDTNVVYPLGWATAPQNTTDFSNTFAATNYGEARICAFIMHNGQKIQDCAKARVVDPNAGGNSCGGNAGGGNAGGGHTGGSSENIQQPPCKVWVPFAARAKSPGSHWWGDLNASLDFNRRYDSSIWNWFLDYTLVIDTPSWSTYRDFELPECLYDSFGEKTDNTLYKALYETLKGSGYWAQVSGGGSNLDPFTLRIWGDGTYNFTSSITRTGSIMRPAQ